MCPCFSVKKLMKVCLTLSMGHSNSSGSEMVIVEMAVVASSSLMVINRVLRGRVYGLFMFFVTNARLCRIGRFVDAYRHCTVD